MTTSSHASPPARSTRAVAAIGRVLLSSVFVAAGVQHVVATDAVVTRLRDARLGHLAAAVAPPQLLVLGTGLLLVVAGAALLAGVRVRAAALVLAAVLIPISITALVGTPGEMGPLMKNVALFGALLQVAAASPADRAAPAGLRAASATEGA